MPETTLRQIREQHPEYNSWDDDRLRRGLESKGYTIVPDPPAPEVELTSPRGGKTKLPADDPRIPHLQAMGWGLEGISNQLGDIVQSGVSAASRAASRAPGAPVDIAAMLLEGGDWGLKKLGWQRTPEEQARFEKNQKALADLQKNWGGEAWSKSWEDFAGPYYQPQTAAGEAVQGPTEMITSFATGPQGALRKTLGGLGAYFGGEGAKKAFEGTPYERIAEIIGQIVGGYGGHRSPDIAQTALATGEGAIESAGRKVGRGVVQHHPTLQEALTYRADLGPEAAVFNMGSRPTGQASGLASLPNQASVRLRDVAHQQVQNAAPRLQQDIDRIFGPQRSRYQMEIDRAQQRASQRPIYQQFRGHPVDVTRLADEIPQLVDAFPQMGEANAALREVIRHMIDPRTGDFINDAGELLGLRYAVIDPMIRKAGARLAQPGQDIWNVGVHTPEGAALAQLRRIINDSLPPEIRQADAVLADTERVNRAYETGRTRIVGRGEGTIEPERLAAEYPNLSASERHAMLQGTSRAINQMAGDVTFQRNAGTATVNPLATPNNLARIETQVPGSTPEIARAARRENALSGNASTITANSATAQRLQGAKEFGADIAPQANPRAIEMAAGTIAAGPWGGVAVPVLSKVYQSVINRLTLGRNTRIQDAAAELLAAQGGNADQVLRYLYALREHMRPTNVAQREVGRLIGFFTDNPLFTQQMGQSPGAR